MLRNRKQRSTPVDPRKLRDQEGPREFGDNDFRGESGQQDDGQRIISLPTIQSSLWLLLRVGEVDQVSVLNRHRFIDTLISSDVP